MVLTKLKICGITTEADAWLCLDCGVDILGFNFFPQSERYLQPETARKIIRDLPFGVISVGILVKPTAETIENTLETSRVNALQIYQPVNIPDYRCLPVPIIDAFRIQTVQDFANLPERHAKMILLDNFSKTNFGGSGKAFDWGIIPADFPRERLVLAGGITPRNISAALERVHPAIIDVASGGETIPGKKDPQKVKALMESICNHNHQIRNLE